jgi:hypothetical protein
VRGAVGIGGAEAYKADEEAGYIYFFSRRKFPGARRTRPVRATKDGNWTASGHGKLVTRGGVNVGCRQTMVFYHKMKKKSDGKTDWAMHEYTSINGPNKQVIVVYSCSTLIEILESQNMSCFVL